MQHFCSIFNPCEKTKNEFCNLINLNVSLFVFSFFSSREVFSAHKSGQM